MSVKYSCFGNGYDRWEVFSIERHFNQIKSELIKTFTVAEEKSVHIKTRKAQHPEKYEKRDPRKLTDTEAYEIAREKAINYVQQLKIGSKSK